MCIRDRDLRVLVDIELHQRDRALGRAHGLLQDRRELLARAAPRCPEINQDRPLARSLDDVAHEIGGGAVLDQIGARLARAAIAENWGLYAHAPLSGAASEAAALS